MKYKSHQPEIIPKKIITLLFILTMITVRGFNQNKQIVISGEKIQLPFKFLKYIEIDKLDPELKNSATKYMPALENELVGFYLSESDLGRLLLDTPPQYDTYIMIEISKNAKYFRFTKSQFNFLCDYMNKQEDSVYKAITEEDRLQDQDKINKVLSKENIEITLDQIKIIPLGIFEKKENYMINSYLSKTKMNTLEDSYDKTQCLCSCLIYIKTKVLMVYVYNNYHDETDLNYVRKISKDICESILAINKDNNN
jgi:hypothetical protein